jgi:chromosome segregation ATPase
MRRADRQDSNDDNDLNHPHSRKKEPTTSRELQMQLATARSQRDEWKQEAQKNQEELQKSQAEVCQWQGLYNETQAQLKYERHSKAGIKGWETRRKLENERLKREISEMATLLGESLARKDDAVNSLYMLAERMDRIQNLVDSVEEETTGTPIGLLQKFRRIWLAIKDILAE